MAQGAKIEILVYCEGRQYDQGIGECERAVEMDPNYAPALDNLRAEPRFKELGRRVHIPAAAIRK